MLNQQAALDRLFHALGDPARRAMVEELARAPATVSELAKTRAISLPVWMRHLKLPGESGLVRTQKQGRIRLRRIEPRTLGTVEDWLAGRRLTIENPFG